MENKREKYETDRISLLPESVLHHILCFISYKKAVQTSVLSKSWRHLGPTRPVIDLGGSCRYDDRHVSGVCENCFDGNEEAFISVLEKTFQRYHEQNLFPHQLDLRMLRNDSQSISLLQKWIPIFINPSLTTFRLSFEKWIPVLCNPDNPTFRLSFADSLRELHFTRCGLEEINSIDKFLLKNIQKLSLSRICISDEALEKVTSGFPLVKRLVLDRCYGFKTINIIGNKNHCLDHLEISSCYGDLNDQTSIEIDVPTLRSIRIEGWSKWYRNHSNYYFSHLKSMLLSQLNLPNESFHYFSCNFPCLQVLSLHNCYGYEEINLSSRSIKRLHILGSMNSFQNVSIDVPNILHFELSNSFLPATLSLATTSGREWKSHLNLHYSLHGHANDVLPRILKLFGIVKAVSQSQISLGLCEALNFQIDQIEWDFNDHPVVIQHLDLNIRNQLRLDSLRHFLNALFRIFRPRYMTDKRWNADEEVAEFLWKTLIYEREKTEYGWEQHLEEVSIEVSDKKGKVWHLAQWTCLPEWTKDQQIRFRLKWRD